MNLEQFLKPLQGASALRSYDAGYDCGMFGSNTTNCHFCLFSKPEFTRAWEAGNADAVAGRPNRYLESCDLAPTAEQR